MKRQMVAREESTLSEEQSKLVRVLSGMANIGKPSVANRSAHKRESSMAKSMLNRLSLEEMKPTRSLLLTCVRYGPCCDTYSLFPT